MKAKLLIASSAIALAALVGAQLPSTELGQAIGNPFGMTMAMAQTTLPLNCDESDLDPADIEDDDD